MDGTAFTHLKRTINHSWASGSPAEPVNCWGGLVVTGTTAVHNVRNLSSAYFKLVGQTAESSVFPTTSETPAIIKL